MVLISWSSLWRMNKDNHIIPVFQQPNTAQNSYICIMDEGFYELDHSERINYISNYRSCRIRFYKEDGSWYADVEEHTKEENLMVAGADVFLEHISGNKDEITLRVTDLIHPKPVFLFHRISHNGYGATYEILESHPESFGLKGCVERAGTNKLRLGNVVHTVLGEHPEYISVI